MVGWVRGVVFATGALMVLGGCATAPPTAVSSLLSPHRRDVHGYVYACTVQVSEYSNTAFYEPIMIVGEHSELEDWWVYYRARDPKEYVGIDGLEHAVNVPKVKVLFEGEHRVIKGVMCRCPGGE